MLLIRGKRRPPHSASMSLEHFQGPTGFDIPKANGPVEAAREREPPLLGKADSTDARRVAGELPDLPDKCWLLGHFYRFWLAGRVLGPWLGDDLVNQRGRD